MDLEFYVSLNIYIDRNLDYALLYEYGRNKLICLPAISVFHCYDFDFVGFYLVWLSLF